MGIWQKIKQGFFRLMRGRHGADQLNLMLLWLGLGLYVLGALLNAGFLTTVSLIPYGLCIFRMFSRNNAKRSAENSKYLALKAKLTTRFKQAKLRFANRKQYKYFKCPGCKAWLKLPRGTGVATVTCGKCQNSFTQKA